MKVEVGQYYSMIRITGALIKFKLKGINKEARSFEMEMLNNAGNMTIYNISEGELRTIKKLDLNNS